VDVATPTWASGGYSQSWGVFDVSLNLTATAPVQVNIGDTWKSVASAKISVSGVAWSYVNDVQINIGDTWKEIR